MAKPYIVFFTEWEHGRNTFLSVYKIFEKDINIDTTLIWWNKEQKGLSGKNFQLGPTKINRKPDVLVLFSNWWGVERITGEAAVKQKIPVVMINHGAMFIFNKNQTYKTSIFPASVDCLWGQYDLDLWNKWNKKDKFIITGNPLHDQIINYAPPKIDVPNEFALLLTPRGQRKFLNPSAEKLNKIIPVVAKTHPLDKEKDYYKQRYLTYDEPWTLLPLLYKAKLIITNVSSAFIPALFWQKPIFIHSFDENGHGYKEYDFSEFKNKCNHIFNFKHDDVWNNKIIDEAIIPSKKHFKLFGHMSDGKNSTRVANVIKSYVK